MNSYHQLHISVLAVKCGISRNSLELCICFLLSFSRSVPPRKDEDFPYASGKHRARYSSTDIAQTSGDDIGTVCLSTHHKMINIDAFTPGSGSGVYHHLPYGNPARGLRKASSIAAIENAARMFCLDLYVFEG